MAEVKIRFFGMLREIVGKREETLVVRDADSVMDLIKLLSSKHGKKFSDFVFDKEGNLRDGFAYAINGDSVSESKLSSVRCRSVREFVILPPISGG
jgi:molybdopterin converting factor small subunit